MQQACCMYIYIYPYIHTDAIYAQSDTAWPHSQTHNSSQSDLKVKLHVTLQVVFRYLSTHSQVIARYSVLHFHYIGIATPDVLETRTFHIWVAICMMCGVSAFEREGGAKLGWNTVPQMCADFKLGEVTKLVHQLRDG